MCASSEEFPWDASKVRKDQVTGGKICQVATVFKPGKVHLAELLEEQLLCNQLAQWFIFHHSKFGSLTHLHNNFQARNATKTGVFVVQNVLRLAFAHF